MNVGCVGVVLYLLFIASLGAAACFLIAGQGPAVIVCAMVAFAALSCIRKL